MWLPVMTGRAVLAPAAQADHIADGVDGDGQAELVHPAHDQVAADPVVVGEREPRAAAAGQRSDPIECVEPAEQAIEIDPRRSRHTARPSSMRQ